MSTESEISRLLDDGHELVVKKQYSEAIAVLEGAFQKVSEGEVEASPSRKVHVTLALIQALEAALRQQPDPDIDARSLALQRDIAAMLDSEADLPSVERARAWASLGGVSFMRSRWSHAADCYSRSVEVSIGDDEMESLGGARARAWHDRSAAFLRLGDADEALSSCEHGMAFVQFLSSPQRRVLTTSFTIQKGTALLLLWRFPEALEIFENLSHSLPEGAFLGEVRERLAFARAGAVCRFDERGALMAVAGDVRSNLPVT